MKNVEAYPGSAGRAGLILAGLASIFAMRLRFIESPAAAILHNTLGSNASLDRIEYRLFNRVTVEQLSVEKHFNAAAQQSI